jgi:hypothetical protein
MLFNVASAILGEINSCQWIPEIWVQALPANGLPGRVNLVDYIAPKMFIPDPSFPIDASLRIIGFQGDNAEDEIANYIIKQAMVGGTELKRSQGYSNKYQKNDAKW